MLAHRAPIISAAARHNVPAVYTQSDFTRDGGLFSYDVDRVDNWRRAASYVDRILRGEKPGDLPVQFPTKFADASVSFSGRNRSRNLLLRLRGAHDCDTKNCQRRRPCPDNGSPSALRPGSGLAEHW